jgi:hypothetical protein
MCLFAMLLLLLCLSKAVVTLHMLQAAVAAQASSL